MTNLLQETKAAIQSSEHTEADIVFIGSEKTGHQCTWAEFCALADVEYDSGRGITQVAQDLVIVFSDGLKMWRGEDDCSEWWEYSTPAKLPAHALPIRTLLCPPARVGWVDLAVANNA